MKKLSRSELKNVIGGNPPVEGGCYVVYSSSGQSSCWYSSSGNALDLCERVYGNNCEAHSSNAVNCQTNNCTMN